MKTHDAIKVGSVVKLCIQNDEKTSYSWLMPIGTLGRVIGQHLIQKQHYWEVSFPLPQVDSDGYVIFPDEDHPDIHVFYQHVQLKKVHGKDAVPVTLAIARFADESQSHTTYTVYDVTHDERAHATLDELNTLSCADLAVLASAPVSQVEQVCAEHGWHLLYKEGDRFFAYAVKLHWQIGEEVKHLPVKGSVRAASREEASQRAARVLLRDYPREEQFSGHERVKIIDPLVYSDPH